jgi:iron complex outermembrane receptor protein
MKTLKINSMRERLLASSMICGAAFLGLSATQAFAAEAASSEVSEIVVTGTRIPSPNLTSVSPLVSVSQEDVKAAGTTTIDTLTNSLPSVIGGQNLGQSIASTGAATIDLRGLGPARTLVLINGRRLQPGDPQFPFADLNNIPAPLVERIDVVTGGASAVYGADAVAGVVNFIMVSNFEGVRLDAQYSFFNHHQHDDVATAALKAGNYTVPGNRNDGQQVSASAVFGTNFADGKGNITIYGAYFNAQPVTQSTRDYAACGLYSYPGPNSVNSAYDSYRCFGSSNNAYGRFRMQTGGASAGVVPPNTGTVFATNPDGTKTFIPLNSSLGYNFNTLSYLQRQDDRYNAGYFAHYEINPAIELYSEFMFTDDRTRAQYAPSGLFAGSGAVVGQSYFNVNCNNPLLSASQATAFCGAAAGTPALAAAQIGYRFAAVPRSDSYTHSNYRLNFGMRGSLGDGWSYDTYAQLGRASFQDTQRGYASLANIQKALLVNPDGTCYSGGDCVPLDIFSSLGRNITPAAYNYLLVNALKNGDTTEQILSGSVSGDLGKFGITSPWATDGAGVAFGAEYRRESLNYNVDNEYVIGDLSGGSQSKNNNGSFDVYEVFGELRVPLIQDQPFIKALSIEGGYRFSDYSTGVHTDTYKGGVEYSPIQDLRFRASYNRAVRAPNIVELFTPQVQNLFNGQDPCSGASPNASAAACAASGLPASQYGKVDPCPASQCGSLTGGNLNLSPETADTYAIGFVLTPSQVPGLSLSVDYYHIKVKDVIVAGLGGAAVTLGNCLSTGSPVYCSLITRDPSTGDLFGAGFVDARETNTGFVKTAGVDVALNYRTQFSDLGLGDWGGLNFNMVGTYTDSYLTQPITGGGTYECAGLYGAICNVPDPHWRHRARVTWTTPWPVTASMTWRYIGKVRYDGNDPNEFLSQGLNTIVDGHLHAVNYFDFTASWKVKTNLTLRGGINNAFDKDPPRGDSVNTGAFGGGNGNTFPQMYDVLGRNIFVSLTAEF